MRYALLYIATVVLVNFAFTAIPPIKLPNGDLWPPAALVVGFTFVIRDFAQREVGHWVLPAMLAGGIISGVMVDQSVAVASVCAFMTGEIIDWLVYTFTKRPFSQRILLSSAVSTPVDSAVFMLMLGFFSWPGVFMMTGSKMVGALGVFLLTRRRERRLGVTA